jgi:hypothetical protein
MRVFEDLVMDLANDVLQASDFIEHAFLDEELRERRERIAQGFFFALVFGFVITLVVAERVRVGRTQCACTSAGPRPSRHQAAAALMAR